MAPGALSSLNLSCYFSHNAATTGGGGREGAATLLLVYCSVRLGPLLPPCLCCCNQCPTDTHPLGLKYVLSYRCRNYYRWPDAGRIHHCQVSHITRRCPRRATVPGALHGSPHPRLSYYPQICLVTVPLAKPRQLK